MRLPILILLLISYFSFLISHCEAKGRLTLSWNDHWRFQLGSAPGAEQPAFDDKAWERVQVPHTWNNIDALDEHKGYAQTTGWYRRTFRFSPQASKAYHLRFEAVGQEGEVWLNGKRLGKHIGGYTAFQFDLTGLLKEGENVLAVKANNENNPYRAPISGDFTFYGGIYRDVWLIETGRTHFAFDTLGSDGVFVQGKLGSANSGAALAGTGAITGTKAKTEIRYQMVNLLSGKVVANKAGTFQLTTALKSAPSLWSPATPVRYPLEMFLVSGTDTLDHLTIPIAFRQFRYTADSGLFLNGKHTELHGTCRHADMATLGAALPDEVHRRDMADLKEMGGNFWRAAHYPHDPAAYEACDKLGIIVWAEIPIVNEAGLSDTFAINARRNLLEMIAQNRNHPSIFFWGYMNEVLLRHPGKPGEPAYEACERGTLKLAKMLDSTARKTDPSRLTVMALHYSQRYNISGLADVPQVVGWNLYFGWYHDTPDRLAPFLDEEHKKYPKRSIMISEYGVGSDLRINTRHPEQYDFSNQWMLHYHRTYMNVASTRPWVGGWAIWNLADFGSEGRKETMPAINNKGMMTMDRRKKDIYYFYKALWTKPYNEADGSGENVAYIAARDWPQRNLPIGHLLLEDTLLIFSNMDITGYISQNGQRIGHVDSMQKLGRGIIKYPVRLGPGSNHFQLHIKNGNQLTVKDAVSINTLIPLFNNDGRLFIYNDVGINVGAGYEYYDPFANQIWLPDQPYSKAAGWGYLGGKVYRSGNRRVGIQDRVQFSHHQPLFQTMRDSLQGYRFDVENGEYEVELLLCEPKRVEAAVIYDLAASDSKRPAGLRQFDIRVNGETVLKGFPQGYDAQEAVTIKTSTKARHNKGILIDFANVTGGAVLSGIRVRRL